MVQGLIPDSWIPHTNDNGHGLYDIETSSSIIEVKACKVLTKGSKFRIPSGEYRYGKRYLHQGRFSFFLNSHNNLVNVALEKSKFAEYVFVLYELSDESIITIINTARLSWKQADDLIKESATTWTRKDGAQLLNLQHTKIFTPFE